MSVPKLETIERHLDNGDAVGILRRRGVLSDLEAEMLWARIRKIRDESYDLIYGPDKTERDLEPFT